MKEIKAFIHRHRVADVIHGLTAAGFRDLSIVDVKGMLKALDAQEQEYSVELGEKVITEIKLELVCTSDHLAKAVEIIRKNGRTGQSNAGWIYVSDIEAAYTIEDGEQPK